MPARIPDASAAELRRLAVETFLRVGCAGLARVDFFVEDDGRVLVNELNTLPGRPRACRGPRRATGCSASRSSVTAPSAAATASDARAAPSYSFGALSVSCVIATWSLSGGSSVIQTR